MIDIKWADPPDPKGGALTRKEQRVFADELKARPDCWATYPIPASASPLAIRALASRISRGRQAAFGSGFEAVSRNGIVYVRYVGGAL